MKNLKRIIEKIRQSPVSVVITGETGTGKELVARQLRPLSEQGDFAPFIAIDSATIQSSTAESILFGHEKGAFTGAEKLNKGIFEEAHDGVVYFDEIANMPLDIQAKLLRVLQEKEVSRLGSTKVIQLHFRTICATNCDLEKLAREGQFKYDLLQRLNVIPIHLPPLRERTEDIPLLIQHMTRKNPSPIGELQFTPEALELLKAYSWPGNIRELSNLVAYLSTLVDSPEVDVADLPPKLRDLARAQMQEQKSSGSSLGNLPENSTENSPKNSDEKQSFYKKVAGFEEKLLNEEYHRCKGNISQLALVLGMDRSHLYTKLKEFGIHSARRGSGS
jgi:DNA-binding NtrC family response regulator